MNPELYESQNRLRGAFWWFVGRRDIFERALRRVPRLGSCRLLDIGPGPGTNREIYALTQGPICLLDNEALTYRLWSPPPPLKPLLGDVFRAPVRDGAFDVVLLLDVLEHLEDDVGALREILRTLSPGGHLLVAVPALKCLWSWNDVQNHHHRRYGLKELKRKLAEAGYTVREAWYFNFFMSIPAFFVRQVTRRVGRLKEQLEMDLFPRPLNAVFVGLLKLENALIDIGFRFPWGASCLVLAAKPAVMPERAQAGGTPPEPR